MLATTSGLQLTRTMKSKAKTKDGYEVKGREVTYLSHSKYWPVLRDDIGYYRLDFTWNVKLNRHDYIKAISLDEPEGEFPVEVMFRDRKTIISQEIYNGSDEDT